MRPALATVEKRPRRFFEKAARPLRGAFRRPLFGGFSGVTGF